MNIQSKVLQILEEKKGSPVSGSALAKKLCVSRNAVWKAVNSLREKGYSVESLGRKGYLLDSNSDVLSSAGILAYMDRDTCVTVYDTVDSTNTVATQLAMEGCLPGTVVIAGEQTKGRGRRGRFFYSPPGTGLYMSIVLKPLDDPNQSILLTTAASVAVAKAINDVCGIQPKIKWVNDVYIDGMKVCGILTEAITDLETGRIAHLVLGIGINCFTCRFPAEAGPLAGSIAASKKIFSSSNGNRTFSKNNLAANVIDNILSLSENITEKNFLPYYREHSMIIGEKIQVFPNGGEPYSATAVDIQSGGGLLINLPDGRSEVLTSGEITIRPQTT